AVDAKTGWRPVPNRVRPMHWLRDEANDERHDERENTQRLCEHNSEDHVRHDLAGCLWVTADSLHGLAANHADADSRPEHAETCSDSHREELSCFKFHNRFLIL